jgi:hypothetical protein
MIPADLLDKLREKDPALWEDIYEAGFNHCQWPDFLIQGCLQEAIRARKWLATVHAKSDESNHRCLARLDSEDDEIETVVEYGSTEAEALLRAYLAALEATE